VERIIETLNQNYAINFDRIELLRDGGSMSYLVWSGEDQYFLRAIKPALFDTAITGVAVQLFLQNHNFPVPTVILSKEGQPFVKTEDAPLILYEFIDGEDSNPEQDAEAIGALTGRLHSIMQSYPGEFVKRDKYFYIGRYLEILRKRQYPRIDEYVVYGDALWEEIKDLPRGYCHGDLYNGNIRKSRDGKLYLHDFDTACEGFPMYDPALICDRTEYFKFDEQNFEKSAQILSRFVPEYRKHHALKQCEINTFFSLIAVQHFSTQATIMEIYGLDCLSDEEIDSQLDWLYRWREQYNKNINI
jgi:Ser/Thr protein kinase RdoA (MazF antagonist)